VSSVAATGGECKDNMLSYCLGECRFPFYDHPDLASSAHGHVGNLLDSGRTRIRITTEAGRGLLRVEFVLELKIPATLC